jgi:hypothetical protein
MRCINNFALRKVIMPLLHPSTTIDADTVYMSAGWLRKHLRVSDQLLVRMLTASKVRVLTNVGRFPTYSVSDVRAYLKENGYHRDEKDEAPPTTRAAKRRRPKPK